uniref:Kri1-like C-terminal domain-containing protein n=1 Tax=Dunaliella tertiolecta TaxID=3047 RepID=A0A7S3VJ15_DUNTE|mmetsp:Transcript_28580/g.77104  ORF Transcript_28580/g.77104 Transcript_28580/m.77104 type:complete len:785 (-) Transcript_28580:174-2528(-)
MKSTIKSTKMPSKKKLLDEDEEEQNLGKNEDHLQLKVNKEFAARFEHNKKREELHRLQAKHPEIAAKVAAKQDVADGEDEDSSSSEDEDDGYIPEDTERRIFETLLRIKRKDPAIYDSSVAFFPEAPEEEEEEGGASKPKGEKPLYLKDVLARQALERGPEASSSSDEEQEEEEGASAAPSARKPKAYDTEQEQLRRSFLEAAKVAEEDGGGEEEDGFEGVLKKRSDATGDLEASTSDEDAGQEQEQDQKKKSKKNKKRKDESEGPPLSDLLDAYFAEQRAAKDAKDSAASTDANEQFLRSFILNRGWVDHDEAGYVPTYEEVVGKDPEEGHQPELVDDDEDEKCLEETDRFEAAYNFRFEEPGTAKIASHPRVIEGIVRKEDDRRKRQREAKKQRKEAEMAQHAEEIKRLKNLKKKEIEEKLALIHKVAGAKKAAAEAEAEEEEAAAAAEADRKKAKKKGKKKEPGFKLDPSLLENDFDPEAWDRQMAEAFNDDYYAEEDEEAALAAGEMDDQGGDLFADGEEEEEQGGTQAQGAGQQQGHAGGLSKEERAAGRAEMAELLEQYFKLDHEGEAGGQKTRFRYKQVPANTFGLSAEDLLIRDDKELNQIVGLKKLAPYREDQAKQRPNYKALQALRASGGGDDGGSSWPQKKHKGGHKQQGDFTHKAKHKGQKRPRSDSHDSAEHANGGDSTAPDSEKAQRLASYAKLSLNKPGQPQQQGGGEAGGGGKKHKKQRVDAQASAPAAAQGDVGNQAGQTGPKLTKAQKKNLKRDQKRKAAKASGQQ